jgi:hypothetical protein
VAPSSRSNSTGRVTSTGSGNGSRNGNCNGKNGGKGKTLPKGFPLKLGKLSPQQIAVITALLTNALIVDSVLVDRNQEIEVVLVGSLRRKNKADKLLEELGGLPFAEVLESLVHK